MESIKSNKFRRINVDLLLASTSLIRNSKESNDTFLARVTHLHMQAKKIRFIEGLDSVPNLKVGILSSIMCISFCNLFLKSAGSLSLRQPNRKS